MQRDFLDATELSGKSQEDSPAPAERLRIIRMERLNSALGGCLFDTSGSKSIEGFGRQ